MTVIRAMVYTALLLSPLALAANVFVHIVDPSRFVVTLCIIVLGSLCGIVGPLVDERLNGPRPRRR